MLQWIQKGAKWKNILVPRRLRAWRARALPAGERVGMAACARAPFAIPVTLNPTPGDLHREIHAFVSWIRPGARVQVCNGEKAWLPSAPAAMPSVNVVNRSPPWALRANARHTPTWSQLPALDAALGLRPSGYVTRAGGGPYATAAGRTSSGTKCPHRCTESSAGRCPRTRAPMY